MDARLAQSRKDAPAPRAPFSLPICPDFGSSFLCCRLDNRAIDSLASCSEGYLGIQKERLAVSQTASRSHRLKGRKAGGRIRDYPSQKDPIPEVALQPVSLNCSVSRNLEQPACTSRTFASCYGPLPLPR